MHVSRTIVRDNDLCPLSEWSGITFCRFYDVSRPLGFFQDQGGIQSPNDELFLSSPGLFSPKVQFFIRDQPVVNNADYDFLTLAEASPASFFSLYCFILCPVPRSGFLILPDHSVAFNPIFSLWSFEIRDLRSRELPFVLRHLICALQVSHDNPFIFCRVEVGPTGYRHPGESRTTPSSSLWPLRHHFYQFTRIFVGFCFGNVSSFVF